MSTQSQSTDSTSAARAPQAPGPVATPADPALAELLPLLPGLQAGAARTGRANQPRRTAAILQMQRTIGNRHTRQVLQRATAAPQRPPLVIQRQLDLDKSWNGYYLVVFTTDESDKINIQKKFATLESEEARLSPHSAWLTAKDKAQFDIIQKYIAAAKARKQIPYTEKTQLETAIDQHIAAAQKIAIPKDDPARTEFDTLKQDLITLNRRKDQFTGTEDNQVADIERFIKQIESKPGSLQQKGKFIAIHQSTVTTITARLNQDRKDRKKQKGTPAAPVQAPAIQPPPVKTLAPPDPAAQQLATDKQKLKTSWEDQAFQTRIQDAAKLVETKKDKPVSDKLAAARAEVEAAKTQPAVTKAQQAVDDLRVLVDNKLAEKAVKIATAVQNLAKDYGKDATESQINTAALKQKVPGAMLEISSKYHTEQRTATFVTTNADTIKAKTLMSERTALINDMIAKQTIRGTSVITLVKRGADDPPPNFWIEVAVNGLPSAYTIHAHINGRDFSVSKGKNPVHIKNDPSSYSIDDAHYAKILPTADEIEAARKDRSLCHPSLPKWEDEAHL